MTKLEMIRQAFADYVYSEGCECCQDGPSHAKAMALLGDLLDVPKYPDGSGHDFKPFRSVAGKKGE